MTAGELGGAFGGAGAVGGLSGGAGNVGVAAACLRGRPVKLSAVNVCDCAYASKTAVFERMYSNNRRPETLVDWRTRACGGVKSRMFELMIMLSCGSPDHAVMTLEDNVNELFRDKC